MSSPITLIVACAVTAAASLAQPGTTAVRAAQRARFDAVIRRDSAGLDTLLDASLRYTHSSGEHETKAQFMATVLSGRIRYLGIEPDSIDVQMLGNVATAIGRSRMHVINASGEQTFNIRFSETWIRRGSRWELAVYHASRLADK
jgi:hypothetical protein